MPRYAQMKTMEQKPTAKANETIGFAGQALCNYAKERSNFMYLNPRHMADYFDGYVRAKNSGHLLPSGIHKHICDKASDLYNLRGMK